LSEEQLGWTGRFVTPSGSHLEGEGRKGEKVALPRNVMCAVAGSTSQALLRGRRVKDHPKE